MNPVVLQLLEKKRKSLEHQLSEHIERGKIKQTYEPHKSKSRTERTSQYVDRLRVENASYQFVAVNFKGKIYYVAFGVSGPIISKKEKFIMIPAQVVGGAWGVHYILFYPNILTVQQRNEVFVRIDSGCFSGMVLGDETCDCKSQLDTAKEQCIEQGAGLIVEIPGHDGRGWGEFKMANQLLMDELDMTTVEAARAFYGEESLIDQRTYIESVLILLALGFSSERHVFRLATNNPMKIEAFKECHLHVQGATPVVGEHSNACVERNLKAKQEEWNHNFSLA